MTDRKIINNWLYAFARDVDKKKLADHVLASGNYFWHIFSYKYVPCLEGDEACAEFDRIVYDIAIRFHDGYGGQITSVTEHKNYIYVTGPYDVAHLRLTAIKTFDKKNYDITVCVRDMQENIMTYIRYSSDISRPKEDRIYYVKTVK